MHNKASIQDKIRRFGYLIWAKNIQPHIAPQSYVSLTLNSYWSAYSLYMKQQADESSIT